MIMIVIRKFLDLIFTKKELQVNKKIKNKFKKILKLNNTILFLKEYETFLEDRYNIVESFFFIIIHIFQVHLCSNIHVLIISARYRNKILIFKNNLLYISLQHKKSGLIWILSKFFFQVLDDILPEFKRHDRLDDEEALQKVCAPLFAFKSTLCIRC